MAFIVLLFGLKKLTRKDDKDITMIFRQWQQVFEGTKTQTRRLVKTGEQCRDGITVSKHWISQFTFMPPAGADLLCWTFRNPKWQVGRTYTVQPGRGEKSVGRILVTEIRRERVQDISREDAFAEGVGNPDYDDEISGACLGGIAGGCGACANCEPVWWYSRLWDSIHEKPGTRWADDPEVWVLTFEVAKEK